MLRLAALRSTSSAAGAWVGRHHSSRSSRLVACARLEVERVRLLERERLATAVDRDLREACRAESAARLSLGTHAADLLRRRSYRRLGFVRLADYARERLGISARALESAAFVASRLAGLPRITAAFHAGALSWTQVRALAEIASAADEAAWLHYAREHSIVDLTTAVAARRAHDGVAAAADPDGDLIDDEPASVSRVPCPSRLRSLWRRACELASRVAGEPLPAWRAAEAIAAEGIAGRPAGISVGDRMLLALLRLGRRRSATEERSSLGPGGAATETPVIEASPLIATVEPTASPSPTRDPFEIDSDLRATLSTLRRLEPRIGQLLRVLVDHHLYRALGFRSLDGYTRERLGISVRKVWALVRVERAVRRAPPLARAYEEGRLSWVRTLTLLPVVDRATADAWLARASTVTVRRLQDEVSWVLDRGDLDGRISSLEPPPIDSPLVQIGAHPMPAALVTKNGTAPIEVADSEVRFTAPLSVGALWGDALDVFATPGEPRWRALERLLSRVIADWEAEPSHRDPVFARDGWRCTVPGCTSRRNLHDHHVRYRSRGGGNERTNRTTVCAAHHLHGIHAGIVRVSGAAPAALRWELPLFSCIGDRYV